MAHITMYARRSAPLVRRVCTDAVGGAYGGRWASDGGMTHIMNHVHAHLVRLERASRSLNFLHLLTYYDYDNSCGAIFISIRKSIEMLK